MTSRTFVCILPSPNPHSQSLPRLDSIGNAGFSHDFGALRGETSPIVAVFNSLSAVKPALPMMLALILGPLFRILLPIIRNKRQDKLAEIAASLKVMATDLLEKARKEAEAEGDNSPRSILGVLSTSVFSGPCFERCELYVDALLV
jgi:hypothetical protein